MIELVTKSGIQVHYPPAEEETAYRVVSAVDRSVIAIQDLWRLPKPDDLRVYLMTSWRDFLFRATPWIWWVPMILTAPFWLGRVRQLWAHAGGWNQPFGRKQRVGIKPPRLVLQEEREIGRRLYVPGESPALKLENVVCHELTHAFTAHLKLAAWLNEGLAFLTTDAFAGRATIRDDTIALLQHPSGEEGLDTYQRVSLKDQHALLRQVARGYWLTRYLREVYPDELAALLSRRMQRQELEDRIAETLAISPESFWQVVDGLLFDHYAG